VTAPAAFPHPPYRYCVYGTTISSEIPLALPEQGEGRLARVELRVAPASHFADAIRNVPFERPVEDWNHRASLPDGSSYLRWDGIGEFLTSADGCHIWCRQFEDAPFESFQVYMLGQALAVVLVKRGFEPLHATAAVVDGRAIVFLGHSGFGKSSLAACFLAAGHRLLTDDLLILHESAGRILAYPGPPRIKLFPKVAGELLGHIASGVPMNPGARKLILPVHARRNQAHPVALGAMYSLAAPYDARRPQSVRIESLSPREAFLEFVAHTFNDRIVNMRRLERQFTMAARLASVATVKKLSYPRVLDRLPDVRAAVLSDLDRIDLPVAACAGPIVAWS